MSENSPKIVALLPMKAHSERVKGKNFKEFCGKPLFKWILDSLLEISEIDQIIINTDAEQILTSHGAVDDCRVCIRRRKPTLCGDLVSMNLVLADDIANTNADIYLMTHTTNPLVSATTIRGALNAYLEQKGNGSVDSLFTVNKVQTRFYREDSSAVNHDPANLIRTQDLEPWYEENSNIYIFTKESFNKTRARIGERPMMYEVPKFESIDIDTPDDWALAEILVKYYQQKGILI